MATARPAALITGGARRIGASITRALHQQQCRVIVHYHDSAEPAQRLIAALNEQRPGSAVAVQANLNDPAAVRDLAARASAAFGTLDVLVNNASRFYPTPLADADDHDWEAIMHSNLRAPFLLSQHLATTLAAGEGGAIINLIDVYAEKPLLDHSLYCMAKAGLAMMTRSLARELSPAVRVNGVAPGAVLWPEHGQPRQRDILDAIALGRTGEPDEVADAVAWLALHASYVTGQILAVDGGRSLSFPGG